MILNPDGKYAFVYDKNVDGVLTWESSVTYPETEENFVFMVETNKVETMLEALRKIPFPELDNPADS